MRRWIGPSMAAAAALAVGGLVGNATVAGIRPRPVATVPLYPTAIVADAGPANPDTDCPGCTRYDGGYRFAAATGATDRDQCLDDDWSFQSGCLAAIERRRDY